MIKMNAQEETLKLQIGSVLIIRLQDTSGYREDKMNDDTI